MDNKAKKVRAGSANGPPAWQELCRELEVDPEEVRIVFSRYDAYRQFTANGNGDRLSIDQWFRFYHLEKTSEGEQAGPAPSGCSVDSQAVNNACIKRPNAFIKVLRAYLAAEKNDSL